MGIESDQLVYDYLSRVGDLAQRQQLSSGARMRLVSTLRGEIDRQRTKDGSDSPAVVRRIIGRLGTPDELVARAAAAPPPAEGAAVTLPAPRRGAEPDAGARRDGDARRDGVPGSRRGVLRKERGGEPGAGEPGAGERCAGEPRKDASGRGASAPGAAESGAAEPGAGEPAPGWPAASAPHMAGLDQQPPAAGEPDWWRTDPAPFGAGVDVPGFVGGLESPELFGPAPATPAAEPEPGAAEAAEAAGDDPADAPADDTEDAPAPRSRRPRLRLRRRRTAAPAAAAPGTAAPGPARARFANPFLLLAATLLVAGAVLGSWVALAGGWLLAYSSRKLSRAEAKWVAMGLPGAVVAGAFVWLWGRMDGRWGSPIREDAMGDAMTDAWPVIVRVAALASALYLVWRARRLSR